MNADIRKWVVRVALVAVAFTSLAASAATPVPGGKWSWVWTDRAGMNQPMRVYTYRPRACDTTCPILIALHGALRGQAAGSPAAPGYLASARAVTLHRWRLDDLPQAAGDAPDELQVQAQRLAADDRQILYQFTVSHAGVCVAQGRAAVVLSRDAQP